MAGAKYEQPASALLNVVEQIYTCRMKQQFTFLQAKCRRTFFCMTMAAATIRAWRAALAAALRPAAVVRLKRVRTSHMRTQLCTTVALRFLHPRHHKLRHIHHTQSTVHTIPLALLASVFTARLVALLQVAERTDPVL